MLIAAVMVTATLHAATGPEPGEHRFTIHVGSLDREYVVYVPRGYDGTSRVPVVIMFHGGGGTARGTMTETGWTAKADEARFLAVFPEGARPDTSRPGHFVLNPQVWNDGSGRFAALMKADDVGYIRAAIDDVRGRFAIDARRIYACGFSNGASMTFRVGEELADRIAAIAPVAGACWKPAPAPSRAVPCLYITGTDDPLNPLAGGEIRMPWSGTSAGTKPSVWEDAMRWARGTGCGEASSRIIFDRDGVKATCWGPGRGGCEVLLYTIEGMGHTWAGGRNLLPEAWVGRTSDKISATDLIWEFFQRHALPAPPS